MGEANRETQPFTVPNFERFHPKPPHRRRRLSGFVKSF
ncbi:hypothetical protein SPLC1_S412440 [Arthrospira platensis C1]|nr:hypothetical protein SPLC1_S412440 [Arthrospira platensis C1]